MAGCHASLSAAFSSPEFPEAYTAFSPSASYCLPISPYEVMVTPDISGEYYRDILPSMSFATPL